MSKKEDNTVKLRKYIEILSNRFVQEMLLDCIGLE